MPVTSKNLNSYIALLLKIFSHVHTALFLSLCLCWVFVAAGGLSLVAERGAPFPLWCAGFSAFGARAPGTRAAVAAAWGLSICDWLALGRVDFGAQQLWPHRPKSGRQSRIMLTASEKCQLLIS